MTEKILFVDDDLNILTSLQRQFRSKFKIDTANSGELGLTKFKEQQSYAVVVSDMRMPGMNGVQFLSRVREVSPDSVRIILTGYADLPTVIDAVNEGNIFRFLSKPCHPDIISRTITECLKQYRLVQAEKELLEETLKGSIKVLTEVLALVNPEAFGRSSRLQRLVRDIANQMEIAEVWQFETAAMLSQIGCVILPETTLKKIYQGQKLNEDEIQLYLKHPAIAAKLLTHIPRMQEIAVMIANQEKHFDGSGFSREPLREKEIPLGARILKVALDFDTLETMGNNSSDAIHLLENRNGWYDPEVLIALKMAIGLQMKYEEQSIMIKDLREKMIFDQDVRTPNGLLLIARGLEVSFPMIERLKIFVRNSSIQEPLRVLVPKR